MCSYNDDDGWVYNDDDYDDYEDYLGGDEDEAIERVLEDVVVDDDDDVPVGDIPIPLDEDEDEIPDIIDPPEEE